MSDLLKNFKTEFFKALAHPLRIRILESLRGGEKNVSELQSDLGYDQSAVSQQLSILRAKGFLITRKIGTNVLYQVREPLIFEILDITRIIFNNHLLEVQDLLGQLAAAEEPSPSSQFETEAISSQRQTNNSSEKDFNTQKDD